MATQPNNAWADSRAIESLRTSRTLVGTRILVYRHVSGPLCRTMVGWATDENGDASSGGRPWCSERLARASPGRVWMRAGRPAPSIHNHILNTGACTSQGHRVMKPGRCGGRDAQWARSKKDEWPSGGRLGSVPLLPQALLVVRGGRAREQGRQVEYLSYTRLHIWHTWGEAPGASSSFARFVRCDKAEEGGCSGPADGRCVASRCVDGAGKSEPNRRSEPAASHSMSMPFCSVIVPLAATAVVRFGLGRKIGGGKRSRKSGGGGARLRLRLAARP